MRNKINRASVNLMVQRYPYVATEVLCSDIWSIVETCVHHSEELLAPFWETVLDRPPEDMKTGMVMASHFAKINAVFLTKKPAEVGCNPSFFALLVAKFRCRCLRLSNPNRPSWSGYFAMSRPLQ